MAGILSSGNVFINRHLADGSKTGYYGPVNATRFAVTPGDTNAINRPSRMKTTYGQNLDSVQFPGAFTIAVDIDEADAAILQYGLLGSLETASQGAGTATDEAIVAKIGHWQPLAMRNLTASSVQVQDDTDTTTYTEDTDYEIDYAAGLIRVIEGGDISAGVTLHVDYGYGAYTADKITGGAGQSIRATLLLDATNLATQKDYYLMVHEAVLTPGGEMDFMSDSYIVTSLTGELVTPTGKNGPFEYVYLKDVA